MDESYAPSLQDDEMEVEHLHAEPRNEHGSMDGILYFNENIGRCYYAENLSIGFEFGLQISFHEYDS